MAKSKKIVEELPIKKPKPKATTRTEVIAIRVTAKEQKRLIRLAKLEDNTVSTMTRNWILEKLEHEAA